MKIDGNAAFGDVQQANHGLEGGRAQHGHSSGAHSTPGDQCRDAGVVARWLSDWLTEQMCAATKVHVCAKIDECQLKGRVVGTLCTNQRKEGLRPLGPVCMLGHVDVWMDRWTEYGCGIVMCWKEVVWMWVLAPLMKSTP